MKTKAFLTTFNYPDTGIWPLAIAAVVVGVAQTVAVVYCVQEGVKLIDRKLARDSDERKLAVTQATALKAVEVHTEAEKAAGKTLPLSEALKSLLDGLSRATDRLSMPSEKVPFSAPLESPFGLDIPWGWIALGAVGLGAIYLANQKTQKRSYRMVEET